MYESEYKFHLSELNAGRAGVRLSAGKEQQDDCNTGFRFILILKICERK